MTEETPKHNPNVALNEDKRLSFSRALAGEIQEKKKKAAKDGRAGHGAHEAIVLKYLAYRSRTTKRKDGRKGFYMTLREVAAKFPFIGKTSVGNVVHRLKEFAMLTIWNGNKWRTDKTFWYDVPLDVRDAAEEDIIYFDLSMATAHGVPAAVVHCNFEYWRQQAEENNEAQEMLMSPASLSRVLPFSEDTIKRALADLVEAKVLVKTNDTKPIYSPSTVSNSGGADVDSTGADVDKKGANVDRMGAEVDSNTYCKPFESPLESSSKTESSTPPGETVSKVTETTHGIDTPASTPDASRIEFEQKVSATSPDVPAPVDDEVVDGIGHVDGVTSLHKLSTEYAALISNTPRIIGRVNGIATKFMATLGSTDMYTLYGLANDALVMAQHEKLMEFMNANAAYFSMEGVPVAHIFCFTLEFVSGAFLFRRKALGHSDYYPHAIDGLQRAMYWTFVSID
jgi:hypothetical protein